jgi:hypothetical protein
MKYRLEGFYYGLLLSGFFCFMDWWQYGKITYSTIFSCTIIPLYAAWFLGNSIKKEVNK